MTVIIKNIEWDLEDNGDILTPEEAGVPTEVVIEDPDSELIDACRDGDDDFIADMLSDTYGWCVGSFEFECSALLFSGRR